MASETLLAPVQLIVDAGEEFVGEQDIFECARSEDRLGTQLADVEWIVGWFFGHRITSPRGLAL